MNDRAGSEWVFFRDLLGRWCWEHRVNGTTVLESTQGYATRQECVAAAAGKGFETQPQAPRRDVQDGKGSSPS